MKVETQIIIKQSTPKVKSSFPQANKEPTPESPFSKPKTDNNNFTIPLIKKNSSNKSLNKEDSTNLTANGSIPGTLGTSKKFGKEDSHNLSSSFSVAGSPEGYPLKKRKSDLLSYMEKPKNSLSSFKLLQKKRVNWKDNFLSVVEVESYKEYTLINTANTTDNRKKKVDNGCKCVIF